MKMIFRLLIMGCVAHGTIRAANQLEQVFYHRAPVNQEQLDFGRVSLYFTKDAMINRLQEQRSDGQVIHTFFLPKTAIKSTALRKMQTADFDNEPYKINFQAVHVPTDGVRVTVSYDPDRVTMNYEYFDAISKKKGIVFSFYNKQLLEKMQRKQAPLLQFAWNRPKRIVIDPGHGGRDPGAIGFNGIREKEVCLCLGKQLASLLEKEGYAVAMTRTDDKYVALDERTSFANRWGADLFISLHANASGNKKINGIETYYLEPTLLKAPQECVSASHTTIKQLVAKRCSGAKNCAQQLHTNIISGLHEGGYKVADRKVRPAVFQILVGTTMPALLIEVGFITNELEASRLATPRYCQYMAEQLKKLNAKSVEGMPRDQDIIIQKQQPT